MYIVEVLSNTDCIYYFVSLVKSMEKIVLSPHSLVLFDLGNYLQR